MAKEEVEMTAAGQSLNRKMKPYFVLKYLQKNSDSNNLKTATEIAIHLQSIGIPAEEKSIYRDIKTINIALLMEDMKINPEEAKEMIEDDDDLKAIKFKVIDRKTKGFFYNHENFYLDRIRLLAECVYSSKFVSSSNVKALTDIIFQNISQNEQANIKHNAYLVDRAKTENNEVFDNVQIISNALSRKANGKPHTPQKIAFKYKMYDISANNNISQINGRKNSWYIVDPYYLIINEGNYYLICYDDEKNKIYNLRVDRMSKVQALEEARESRPELENLDLEEYTKQQFSMFSGKKSFIKIRFVNTCLNAVVERLGKKGVSYSKADNNHFTVSLFTGINNQFYGWICTFGNKAKIIEPEERIVEFKEYISKITSEYE